MMLERARQGRDKAKMGECGGHFEAPADKLGRRPEVGLGALDPATEVRSLPPQPTRGVVRTGVVRREAR